MRSVKNCYSHLIPLPTFWMVVGEPLTATLCNCTTSPLKNSALFLRYIFSGYLSVVNLISISNICRHQQAGGWKASSPTVRPHRAEFVILLPTNIPHGRRRRAMRHSTPLQHRRQMGSKRVHHKSTQFVPAMQAADKHELLSLCGVAYYVHVQDMLDRQTHKADGSETRLRVHPKLNYGQVMRLLSGYCSLVSYWERLRLKPPKLAHVSDACAVEANRACMTT